MNAFLLVEEATQRSKAERGGREHRGESAVAERMAIMRRLVTRLGRQFLLVWILGCSDLRVWSTVKLEESTLKPSPPTISDRNGSEATRGKHCRNASIGRFEAIYGLKVPQWCNKGYEQRRISLRSLILGKG